MSTTITTKVNFASLPQKMQKLPIDERGYPVPWFVAWVEGKPEFRAADAAKFRAAIRQGLCWVCGEKLPATVKVFVVGPMCGINRTSGEPPCHPDCARWSAQNCPFLTRPKMVRREDEVMNNDMLKLQSAGTAIARNPGVALLWFCRDFETFNDYGGKTLITMGSPYAVEWYSKGVLATREEVQNSIDEGLPALESVARSEPGGLEALERCKQRFEKWLPK